MIPLKHIASVPYNTKGAFMDFVNKIVCGFTKIHPDQTTASKN